MMPEGLAPQPRLSDSRLFLIALPGCLVALLFLAWLVPLHYSTIDDIMMEGIASGALTGQPEFRLIFINALLGKAFQGLYGSMPHIPWYAGYFLLCQAFAAALMITLVRHVAPIMGVVVAAVGFTFHIYCLSDLQFTTTASLLGAWGVIWLWKLGTRPAFTLKDGMWWITILGLLLAWLLRKEAVAFVLIGLAPMFLLLFKRNRGSWLPRMAMPALAAALLLGTALLDLKMQYDTPEWEQYRAYNQRRGLLQDAYGFHYDAFAEEARHVGWNREAFNLFDEIVADGNEPFTLNRLVTLSELAAPKLGSGINWAGIGVMAADAFKYYRYMLLVAACLLTVVAVSTRRGSWYLWLVPFFSILIILIQGHYFGSKDRLIISGLTQITVAVLAYLAAQNQDTFPDLPTQRKTVVYLLAFFALGASGFFLRGMLINSRIRHEMVLSHMEGLNRLGASLDGAAVINVDGYPAIVNDPFQQLTRPRVCTTAHVVPTIWLAGCPLMKAMARNAGLNPDSSLFKQFVAPNRYMIATPFHAGLTLDFLRTNGLPGVDTSSFAALPYFNGYTLRVYKFQ